MGNCSASTAEVVKPDASLHLPFSDEELARKTHKLAVPGPVSYVGRRYRFAGRCRAGYSGEGKVHVNQDNLLYFNMRRLDVHIFMVLDGCGPDGDLAAFFVKEKLLVQFTQLLVANAGSIARHLKRIFAQVDEMLVGQEDIDAVASGVTAIVAVLDEAGITVANCGDCRAVFGFKPAKSRQIKARPLSKDHTLRDPDERDRCLATGALVRTLSQIDGTTSANATQNWDLNVGEELDLSGDPPRLFEEKLKPNEPAVSFSRALGCIMAKACGVISKPSLTHTQFDETSRMILLGSNGVYEFLTNQAIIDIVAGCNSDPELAAERIVDHAYRMWWQMENQIDDITVIVIFIDQLAGAVADMANALAAESQNHDHVADDHVDERLQRPAIEEVLNGRGIADEAEGDVGAISDFEALSESPVKVDPADMGSITSVQDTPDSDDSGSIGVVERRR